MLKYLFQVEYFDGSFFLQNADDVSANDPKKSAFSDIDQKQVARFSLINQEDNTQYIGVDLEDGHFEANGMQFFLHDEDLKDFRLIFFRRHRHSFNVEGTEKSHKVTYRLGWQTNDKEGKNVQRIMEIS